MPSSSRAKAPSAKTTEPPSKKRKMDAAEQKYYAVRAGFKPGVYTSWAICQQQISGFKGAQCTLVTRHHLLIVALLTSPPSQVLPLV